MKNKILVIIMALSVALTLVGCKKNDNEKNPIIIDDCKYNFEYYYGETIPVSEIKIENSKVEGNLDNFINVCKDKNINPIILSESKIKTYKIEFGFDNIYPLKDIQITNYLKDKKIALNKIDLEVSLDGNSFTRIIEDLSLSNEGEMNNLIDLGNISAKYVRIIFSAESGVGNYGGNTFGLNDVRFHLGNGLVVSKDKEWENAFLRYEGWTGADGIFSFNLTNGHDYIGAGANSTGFVFSDTFIGSVYENNGVRYKSKMINNTLGYYNGNELIFDGMEFVYRTGENDNPQSVFLPDELIGYTENNLINGYGLDNYNDINALLGNESKGVMWLSETFNNEEINFDLESSHDLGSIYLWNYNDDVLKGIRDFEIYYSNDNSNWEVLNNYCLEKASGNIDEPFTKSIDLNGINARYLKIKILSSYEENPIQVGLGKVMIFDEDDNYLFAHVKSSSTDRTIDGNESTARLWLQDGVVIGDYLYVFPIVVKNFKDYFKVYDVSMIKIPIVNERLDYDKAEYFDTPLQSQTSDGGIIYYGAGIMNMSASAGYLDGDGYVYIYGYKDLDGRSLTVARTLPENITEFNKWEYFDGTGWSKNINDSAGIKGGVSAELSVSYISEGMFAGKYMLVVMEDTISGKISYAVSDTPYGEFSEYRLLYRTTESDYLNSAFTYNAKMHPHLSEPGNYLISYNVNSTKLSALSDVDIYRPRFIRCIEVKHK